MNNEFLKYYTEQKQQLNNYLDSFNTELIKHDNSFIKENLIHFKNLNSDGKLIRGTLINLGYKILKNSSSYSYPLAAAFEIFQTSILIHDDIIDNDDLRRGKMTIHSINKNKYHDDDLGKNIALCMGDIGFYESLKIISKNYKDDPKLGEILSYFADVVLKTIDGELLDIITPFKEVNQLENHNLEENIMDIYKLKTAYYTIIGPLSLGIILAGGTKDMLIQIEQFGYKVGIAFQLQDDILGIYGNNIGKTVGSDIKEFKTTLLYAYTKNNDKLYYELKKYYGKEPTGENIDMVRKIFEKSGALEYTNNLINTLYNEALDCVNNMNFVKNEDKLILTGLVKYLKERNK